jgi:HEPN domain-containing protein
MSPNERKPATDEARALLRAAGGDSKTVELLLQHPDAPVSSVCFHAQQYLEKVMKAVLVSNAVVFRRTHDLSELADLLERQGIELPLPREQLRRLGPFAVAIRYEDVEITLTDIDTIAGMMEKAHAWVEGQIHE